MKLGKLWQDFTNSSALGWTYLPATYQTYTLKCTHKKNECSNHLCPSNEPNLADIKVQVESEHFWQSHCASTHSHSLSLESPFAVKASRLLQWWYNGWRLIEIAALNCIMSVRRWDHDHGIKNQTALYFPLWELITSCHIIYSRSKIHPLKTAHL